MSKRLQNALDSIENALLVSLLAGMISLAGLQIVLRNVWGASITWGDPSLRIAVLWVGLLGAMIATRLDNHIRIDLLSRYLPPRANAYAKILNNLFAAIVCALLAFHGARFVLFDWEDGTVAFADVPAWLCEVVIPFGFSIMALRFMLAAVISLRC